MKNTCDCIIPFYNEGSRVVRVVDSVVKVKNLSKIIVVDDGSINKTAYLELKSKFPQVASVRLEMNRGKPNAVKEGLEYVSAQYVLLLDGDLTNIKTEELENAIEKITTNPQIDMIILRRVADKTSLAWLRQDIVTSGQRILKRSDLEKIFQDSSSKYQLEITTNAYMIRNKKRVFWMPFSIHNIWRHQKWGRRVGCKTYLKASLVNLRVGLHNLIWQTLFFCKNEAP